ncbi:MAG: polysaccharide biosynthesis C-terminal domain-containing protein [Actinomycetota bacterium]|nr:polysaccharide biosynthesis C-terminal domain-containing protein [Actinomycetota bacterium]
MYDDKGEPVDLLDSPEAGGAAIRGTLIRSAAFAGGLLLNLVSAPFMIRHLGAVQYGYYITVASIVFIIAAITEAGLTNLGIRYYAAGSGDLERASVIRNLVGLRLVLTGAGLVLATAATALAGAPGSVVVGISVYGLGLLLTMISSTYAVPLSAGLRLGTTSALEFLRQSLIALGTIGFVLAGAGLFGFFALSAAVNAVVVVVTVLIVRGHVSIRPAFDRATWAVYLRQAVAYGIAAAAGIVYFRVAAALMSFLSTDLQTGYFAAPFRIVEIATSIPWLFVTSVFPILARAARDDHARLRFTAQRVLEVGVVAGSAMTLVLAAGADVFIPIVAGRGFADAVPVLRLESLTLLATFIVAAWSLLLLSLHEQRALLIINGVAVVAALVGAVLMIPPFGAMGGAGVVVLAETLVAGASVFVLKRKHPDVAPSFVPLWRVGAATALASATLLLHLAPVPRLGVLIAVDAAALLALRAIPSELWPALRGAR